MGGSRPADREDLAGARQRRASASGRTESVGRQRMTELQKARRSAGGDVADARASRSRPGLWAGYGLVRGGAGTALVGSHEQVADLIEEYHRLGFDHFILSGQPHVEEAYHFAEGAAAVLQSAEALAPLAARNQQKGSPKCLRSRISKAFRPTMPRRQCSHHAL